MRSLDDVIATLRSQDIEEGHMYSSLAPVYDFVYERHFDYDDQCRLVTDLAPDAQRVLEVGCGTGRLLARLEQEYDTVVGLDLHESMAERARARTDDTSVVVGDATQDSLEATFDAVVALGRITGHTTIDEEVRGLFENVRAHLEPDGVALFDYFPTERMEDGKESNETFESERFRVRRQSRSTTSDHDSDTDPDRLDAEFTYELADRESGDTAKVTEEMSLRTFTAEEIRQRVRDAGFADVRIDLEGADGWPLVVARQTERND